MAKKTAPQTLQELFGGSQGTKDSSAIDADSASDELESNLDTFLPGLQHNRSIYEPENQKPKNSEKKKNVKSKTIMCRNMVTHGHCKFGDECSYAHHESELVQKREMPSNYKTKLCTQFHETGFCLYGDKCQFLHSTYDLREKLDYKRGLPEEARLTWHRLSHGSDCIFVNLVHGKGCVAPEKRLPVFEEIYNKDDFNAAKEKENHKPCCKKD